MQIALDDPTSPDVLPLLEEHLRDMWATSPPESVHALDPQTLAGPEIAFFTVRENGALLGCGALKELSPLHGELKSMRTSTEHRGRGVATTLLEHLIGEARARGYTSVSLETGVEDYFESARRLYERHGFTRTVPFADYTDDPNSAYYTLELVSVER